MLAALLVPVRMLAPAMSAPSIVASATVQLVPGLRSSDFQHPDDRRASEALKFLAPVEYAVRRAFSGAEDAIFMGELTARPNSGTELTARPNAGTAI